MEEKESLKSRIHPKKKKNGSGISIEHYQCKSSTLAHS